MNAGTFDLYAGFEGEPELIIAYRLHNSVQVRLRAWIGYFDKLMEAFPSPPGGWIGIAYHHHMDSGWNDGEWIDPSPATTLDIVKQARNASDDEQVVALANALIQICETALAAGGDLVWRLD